MPSEFTSANTTLHCRQTLCLSVTILLLGLASCQQAKPGTNSQQGHSWFGGPSVPKPVGVALLPASGAGTGFVHLKSDESGIDVANMLTTEQVANAGLLTQSGLASGDYDGDGKPDLYFCAVNAKHRLYHNDGKLHFTDVTATAGEGIGTEGNPAHSAVFTDVDGDGKLDLYVCNRIGTNQLFINQGDGKFKEESKERGVDVNRSTVMAAAFDADNDGDLDLFLANNQSQILSYAEYKKQRGMSVMHDWIDWLGGYPFEVAKPEEARKFFGDGARASLKAIVDKWQASKQPTTKE